MHQRPHGPTTEKQARKRFYFHTFLLLSILLVCLLILHYQPRYGSESGPLATTNSKNNGVKRNVFFDFGANEGDSLRSFTSDDGAMGGEGLTGMGKLGKWDLWGFEANPVFTKQLKQLEQHLSSIKTADGENQYRVFMRTESAITTQNGRVTFFLDTVNERANYWGSSLLAQHRDVMASGKKGVTVDGYAISELILSKYSKDDYIVVKMDVEGSEFDLLVDMMKTGAMQYVDVLLCEYHDDLAPLPGYKQVLMHMIQKMGIKQVDWR